MKRKLLKISLVSLLFALLFSGCSVAEPNNNAGIIADNISAYYTGATGATGATGIQGIQGENGLSSISNLTSTNQTGLLKGIAGYIGVAIASIDYVLPSDNSTYCKLIRSSDQAIANDTRAAISFDEEVSDYFGLHDSGTPSKIVIADEGLYYIGGCISWDVSILGMRQIEIRKNDTNLIAIQSQAPIATYSTIMSIFTVEYMFVGDCVELTVYHTKGSSINVLYTGAIERYSPVLWVKKVR